MMTISSLRWQIILCTILALWHIRASGVSYAADEAQPPPKSETPSPPSTEQTPTPQQPTVSPYGLVCELDVFYQWQERPAPKPALAAGHRGPNPPPATEPPAELRKFETFYSRIGEQGMVEAEVRKLLHAKSAAAQAEALRRCEADHQDETGCITRKIKSITSVYGSLDFKTRNSMLSAAEKDCQETIGDCLGTREGEVLCFQNIAPEAPAPPAKPGGK